MSKKISQDQLRKFMKEKRENLKNQKVDSPFAKYSSSGQLSCSICNVSVKSNTLWVTHIVSKLHKENLLKAKKGSKDSSSNENTPVTVKRPAEQSDSSQKKVKTDHFKVPQIPVSPKPTPATNLLAGYSSSDEESDENDENNSSSQPLKSVSTTENLPPDFFDSASSNGTAESSIKSLTEQKEPTATPASKTEALPEGFFDDPILDAKARNIEYKDPIEEEWELFQKSIAEETNLSKSIIQEDLEESQIERGISQIDEQIHQWERKIGLETLADSVKSKVSINDGNEYDSGDTDDDLNEDDLLNWRLKSIKKV